MDERISRQAPRTFTDGLDASVRNLTGGRVSDAGAAHREAKRMLEVFEKAGAHAKDGKR